MANTIIITKNADGSATYSQSGEEDISIASPIQLFIDNSSISFRVDSEVRSMKLSDSITIGGVLFSGTLSQLKTAVENILPGSAPATALPTEYPATYAAMQTSITADPTTKRDFFVTADERNSNDPSLYVNNGQESERISKSRILYNSEYGLMNWRLAFGKASVFTTPPTILVLGDSITADTGATNNTSGFVSLLRNSMQLATGIRGKGYASYDIFVNKTGWTNQLNGTNRMSWKGVSGTPTFTFTENFSNLYIIYSKQPDGGSYSFKIDGAIKTIDCSGSTSFHNVYQALSAGTDGLHTIEVTAPTGNTYIEGFVFDAQQEGVIVHKLGHPGTMADHYRDQSALIKASVQDFAPDLTILALGTNDCGNQISIVNYKEALRQLITSAQLSGDVMILSTPPRDDSALTIKYKDYVDAARAVAIEKNVCHLDLYRKWGMNYTALNAKGFYLDNVHPSQIGHNAIAESLREILGGMPFNGVLSLLYSNPAYGRLQLKTNLYPVNIKLGQRGTDAAVTTGATSLTVSLPDILSNVTMPYTVVVSPNWNTTYWITGKAYNQFVINFGTAAPAGSKVDWIIQRN